MVASVAMPVGTITPARPRALERLSALLDEHGYGGPRVPQVSRLRPELLQRETREVALGMAPA